MQLLSAPDAIAPAVARTRNLLFRPFRWGTFLKLCAVAVFSDGYSSSFNSSGNHHNERLAAVSPHFQFTPLAIAALVVAFLLIVALAILLFYLAVRLRFALFECLIRQDRMLRPGWRLYREQAWRYFLLSIVVGLVFFAVLVVVSLPFVFGFLRLYRDFQAGGPFPLADFLAVVLPFIPILLLVILAAVAVDMILRDFMLPHIALENASAGQAWAAVRACILREKGAFFLYALLRVVLPILAGIAMFIVLIIPAILVFAVFGLMMGGVSVALAGAGAVMILRVFVECLLGLIVFALILLAVICLCGPLAIAVRNYALVFYGGRYQALGDILSPPPPLPPTPVAPSSAPPAPAPGTA
jgi:hypothetical protein